MKTLEKNKVNELENVSDSGFALVIPWYQNKHKEPLGINVIKTWIRRYITNSDCVIIEPRPDTQEIAFYADILTQARIDILFEEAEKKGWK